MAMQQATIVSLGDPFSINIEILERALKQNQFQNKYIVVLVGSRTQWRTQAESLDCQFIVKDSIPQDPGLYFLDIDSVQSFSIQSNPAELTQLERGQLTISSLDQTAELIKKFQNKNIKPAIITLPIHKQICFNAGFKFPGHTEFFEDLCKQSAIMTLVSPQMRVALVSNHLALIDVPKSITQQLVFHKIKTLVLGLKKVFHLSNPRIGVCGLNPHAGDHGMFGTEEAHIKSAIDMARSELQINIEGPLAADTTFYHHLQGRYDAVLAMYHDQGLIPIKTVSFESAVNVSLGLDLLRVSPDHGPATNLYGKRQASFQSLSYCFKLVADYFDGKDFNMDQFKEK